MRVYVELQVCWNRIDCAQIVISSTDEVKSLSSWSVTVNVSLLMSVLPSFVFCLELNAKIVRLILVMYRTVSDQKCLPELP